MNLVTCIIFVALLFTLVQCEQCSPLCDICDSLSTCSRCIQDLKRILQLVQCICQEGYYDDFHNPICLPICGDGMIVDGEDCDDGNFDPFDGCDQCKFGCQDSCQDCQDGWCYECKTNYILDASINICQINCLDYLMIGNPLCQNQDCFDHCVLCENGICKECDETNGWYLIGIKCEPNCGDGIIAQGQEQCDDKNRNPFKFCDQCQLSCTEYCELCQNGLCLQCKFGFKFISKIIKCVPYCDYNNMILNYDECVDNQTNQLIHLNKNCNLNCSQCFNGILCIKCQIGFLLINNQCRETYSIQVYQEQQNNDVELIYSKCQPSQFICNLGCLSCLEGRCGLCDTGYHLENYQCSTICGDGVIVGEEQCEDGNQIQFDGCYNCLFQCQQECLNCQFGKCIECQIGYENIEFSCHESCSNSIITFNEFCDDGNLEPFDGCFNCNYSCDQKCEICNQGICSKCFDQGWELNLSINKCITICGDQIVAGDEQCDDGNDLKNDGCYECQNECQKECLKCMQGICYECIAPHWILNNNVCFCETCQIVCQNECSSCIQGVCYECQSPGWVLDNNNLCIQECGEQCTQNICGDGILNPLIEECDDGNNEIRDGCDKCLLEKGFFCNHDQNLISQGCSRCKDLNCLQCNVMYELQICLECESGYYIDQFQECSQCDLSCIECSQNYKNCTTFNSQFQNQQNQHKCNFILGSFNDFDFYECISKCGNGFLDAHEQCDDSNRDILDGCNEFCQLEEGYIFNLATHSLQVDPYIKVERLQSNNNYYSLFINQSQESLNLSSLVVDIEGFSIQDYNYSVIENNSELDLRFLFFKTIEANNLIHVSIQYRRYYKIRQLEETFIKEIIVVPQRQVYVSKEQRLQGENMAEGYQTLFSVQIYLAPLAVIFGGFQLFLAILDIMSWMNNFYFLNVNYPENVMILFLQAEWSNIINIPSLKLLNKPNDDYYFLAPIKFTEKEIDPLLFNNIQTPIIFAFQVLFTYLLSVIVIKLAQLNYRKNRKQQTKFSIFQLGDIVKPEKSRISEVEQNFEIPIWFQPFFQKCVYLKSNLMSNLMRSFSLSYLDITLAVMLQITNQQTAHNFIVKINVIAAYGFFLLILYLIYISYQISQAHQVKLENKQFFQRYCCFYEEMKTQSSNSMAYSCINLIRKTSFIVSTVTLYSYPIFQTLFCFLSSLLNLLLLLTNNPFKGKKQYILNLVPDFCIFIIVGCSIIFAFQDRFKILKDEQIYQIGWIVGVSIYISIGLQLIFLIQEILFSFWKQLKTLGEYLKRKCIKNQ
ncbi:unnamed protein product (macronuclear) [Paramecium tetraurelia]|uniref:EGF-like domain-containing protein n=1 Tax=Paramecium tetraurelia TaxID=5888 RepID=A0BGU1_PARTE|nr:uncharacterized protein GSPATT00028793001 [Paramecium tetraurelia]CAK57758.1 unnamed protein product [Paramecium tetraurelia]|eukprot:XP_001425156.1 hypothetical protein (macronuclear) [Paramecium tetraurelia strain d4-2]